ncbi:MAG: TOBE domain-containing protein, partial [Planctomycetota bacterium]
EALDALVRVGLDADIAGRKPGALSGGQAQRVALARALAGAPRALLLDEPLSAVDASTRSALVPELSSWLAAFPGPRILVTHDASDALRFADRIVALEGGRVVQTGTRDELARAPRSRYVADLLGLNVFEGEANGSTVSVGSAALTVAGEADGPVTVTVHPRAVALFRARPEGSPRNALELEVATVEPGASRVRVALTGALDLVAEVTPRAVEDLGLVPGQHVWAAVKATEIRVEPL